MDLTSHRVFVPIDATKSAQHTGKSCKPSSKLEKRFVVYLSWLILIDLMWRRKGAKIRSTYITFAQKEKKRLETLISTLSQEVAVREKETARLKGL